MALIILDKEISCIAKHRIPYYGSMVSKRLLANTAGGFEQPLLFSLSANSSTGKYRTMQSVLNDSSPPDKF